MRSRPEVAVVGWISTPVRIERVAGTDVLSEAAAVSVTAAMFEYAEGRGGEQGVQGMKDKNLDRNPQMGEKVLVFQNASTRDPRESFCVNAN